MTLREFLSLHDLSRCAAALEAHAVTLDELRGITDARLAKEVGITRRADRRRLREAAARLPAAEGERVAEASPEITGGRFHLEGPLECGAFGTAYAGFDTETGRRVAVETLSADIAKALGSEELVAAPPRGENLLSVVTLDLEARYIATEPPTTGDLQRTLAGPNLGAKDALRMVSGVLGGLAALHAAQIYPIALDATAVRLEPDGSVRVSLVGRALRKGRRFTGEHVFYAAPEELTGGPVDARADVYSAGILVHRILAGGHPFDPFDSVAASTWSESGERRFPKLPPAMADVVARATAVRPADRFRNAEEFRRALNGAITGKQWFVFIDGVVKALEGRVGSGVRLTGGGVVSAQDAARLLARGAVRPGWETEGGLLVLTGHPLALRRVGVQLRVRGDALEAGASAIVGNGALLRRLPEQPAETEAELALAAWLGGDGPVALSRLAIARARAETSGAHLAIARALHAGLGDEADVGTAILCATPLAATARDHLELAAFHFWESGDRDAAAGALRAASAVARLPEDLLDLTQARTALGGSRLEIDEALARYGGAVSGGSGSTMAAAVRVLGRSEGLIAWAERLFAEAGDDARLLEAAGEAFHALGDPAGAQRCSEAMASSLRARLTSLTRRLAQVGGAAPSIGEQTPDSLDALEQVVALQESLVVQVADQDRRLAAVGATLPAPARPLQRPEVEDRAMLVRRQEALHASAARVDARARALGMGMPAWPRPYSVDELARRLNEVAEQEGRDRATPALDAAFESLGVEIVTWVRPVSERALARVREELAGWVEAAREVDHLREDCWRVTQWMPEAPERPYDAATVSQLRSVVDRQLDLRRRVDALHRQSGLRAPRPPLSDADVARYEATVRRIRWRQRVAVTLGFLLLLCIAGFLVRGAF